MKKVLKTLFFVFVVVFYCNAQIDTAAIDAIVQDAATNNFFEGTVWVAEKGETVYQKSFGHRDEAQRISIANEDRFSIASITKMFTAIVILQLVEEGKFELSDNLKTLLPDLKIRKSKKITVHHLLLHISGLPNEADQVYQQKKSPVEFVNETLSQKGGRLGKFNYANIDYVLLGLIAEKYDGKPWQEIVQNRILNKLNMENTGFLSYDNYPDDFAYSFSFDEDENRQADPMFFIENFGAAGCMYSNAADLLKLDQAMYSEQLLSEKSKQLMFTSYPEYNYTGYSVWTYNYPFSKSNPKIMERRGKILGANVVLIRLLDTNRTIVILSNNNKFDTDTFGNTQNLREALMIAVAAKTAKTAKRR